MSTVILDVREPDEYVTGYYPGAINIPPALLMQGLPQELTTVPLDTDIVVYCRSGSRSAVAIQMLRSFGFTNLTNGINKDHVSRLVEA